MKRRRFLKILGAAVLTPVAARAERLTWQAEALGGTVSVELLGHRADSRDVVAAISALIA